jgi:bifunctional UDP-N-acetylglucosamine pyrophosphorylase/glucosamine-1-phosphate N-acetyltransferase
MERGLKCLDPGTTWMGPRVEIGADVTLEPGVQIWGASRLGDGARVGAWSTLRNVTMERGAKVLGLSVISDSVLGPGAEAGPFAYMRDGVVMGADAKIGRFVEVKNSRVGDGAKAMHLAYLGDAEVGRGANIGAGTVTCNYDGQAKHATKIGEGCFVGSDTMFVAPVTIGDGAFTAAGSVITRDVPDGAMGIARERQTNVEGWREKRERFLDPAGGEPREG